MSSQKFAAPVLSSLTFRETVALLRALNGGAAGFDYGKYRLDGLRHIVNTWLQQGNFSQETLTANIAAIIAARVVAAAPVPFSQSLPPVDVPAFGAAAVMPGTGLPVIPIAPVAAPIAPAAPVVPAFGAPIANVVADAVIESALQAAPVVLPAAAVVEVTSAPVVVLPLTVGDFPRKVPAASLFADQPIIAAALPPTLLVTVYGNPDAPAINPDYIFTPGHVLKALGAASCAPTLRTWLVGPRGSGKTAFVEQLAARMGRPFFRVNFNRATEAADVLGDMGLSNGATVWQDGPVAMALRTAGAVLLLDEISYASTAHTAALNPILEQRGPAVRLPRTGERLTIAGDVLILAADNTSGNGDESGAGEYAGRGVMGSDTLDRFAAFLQFDYLPADDEAKVLRAMVKANCGVKLRADSSKAIIRLCHVARQKADAGELQGAPSLRRAAAFATFIALGVAPAVAWSDCVVVPAPLTSAEELRQIFAAHWPADFDAVKFFAS